MAENKKRRRKVRQQWRPNLIASVLYNVWRIAFAGIKIALGAVATVLLVLVVCAFVFVNVLGDYLVEDVMAKAEFNLDDYDLEKTSYIYYFDDDGNVQILQKLATATDRRWVEFEDIPEDLIHAAVAIEDKRFYEHQGVDWITTVKACANMFFGGGGAGGSTLTQQLIKNLKLTQDLTADDVTVQRKVLEIFRAFAFEQVYDKDVVIEWYMNTVYFGNGCYGVKSAAEFYFGKELQDMNAAEMAALVGITNNPSMFNPYSTKEYEYEGEIRDGAGRNRYRQQVVLTQMYEQGWLTEAEYLDMYNYELVYKKGIDAADRWNECRDVYDANGDLVQMGCGYKGPVRDLIAETVGEKTVYYCPDCKQKIDITVDESSNVYSWYVDTVLEDVAKALAAADGVEWDEDLVRTMYMSRISRSGYHIYTPYNAAVQEAVDSVYTDLSKIPETKGSQQLQSAIVIIDNTSGDIVAMAGGVGEKTVADAYNRATDAERQPGSSIKPLSVYAPAFESGRVSPATIIDDMPLTYNNGSPYPWNDTRVYNYHRTIYHGLTQSLNAVSAQVVDMLGLQYSFNFAKYKFRVSGLREEVVSGSSVFTDIGLAPLSMGALTKGATVRDVTNAYSVFTSGGYYREARTFLAVVDSNGNTVLENTQETEYVMSQKAVDYVSYCLDSAVALGTGTAADLQAELGMAVAGKTGTTQNKNDRYFAGYTGYYTAAVWCGFDNPESISLDGEDRTHPAARLWKSVMLKVHEGKESIPLYNSSKMVQVELCVDSGKIATDACKNDVRSKSMNFTRVTKILVYEEDVPQETCDEHVFMDYCTDGSAWANEYCQLFASVGKLRLEEYAALRLEEKDLKMILAAKGKGMSSNYLRDDYIYLVDSHGNPVHFTGIKGDINQDVNLPCKMCTVHTKEAWEEFVRNNPWADPNQPDPSAPTEPSEPTEPTVPAEPTQPTEPTESAAPGADMPQDDNNTNWWEDLWDTITGG